MESGKGYIKPGYENGKGANYRIGFVIDTNKNDELAIVKGTTQYDKNSKPKKGVIQIKTYKSGKTFYKPFVETLDNEGNAIKLGIKFVPQPKKQSLPNNEVVKMSKTIHKNKECRKKIRKLKSRE